MNTITKVKQVAPKAIPENNIRKSFDIPEDYSESEDTHITFEAFRNNNRFRFDCEIRGDEFCCGMRSVGHFNIRNNTTAVPRAEQIKIVREGFEKLMGNLKEGQNEVTVQFTLIDNPACKLVKEAIKDGKIFTMVKSFRNSNTNGRVNELYISN